LELLKKRAIERTDAVFKSHSGTPMAKKKETLLTKILTLTDLVAGGERKFYAGRREKMCYS
jgi:hypothetical protein